MHAEHVRQLVVILVQRGVLHATAVEDFDNGNLPPEIHGKVGSCLVHNINMHNTTSQSQYLSSMISIDGCGPFLNAVVEYVLSGEAHKRHQAWYEYSRFFKKSVCVSYC